MSSPRTVASEQNATGGCGVSLGKGNPAARPPPPEEVPGVRRPQVQVRGAAVSELPAVDRLVLQEEAVVSGGEEERGAGG